MKFITSLLIFTALIGMAQTKPAVPAKSTVTQPTTPVAVKPTAAETASMKKIMKDLMLHFNLLNDSSSAEIKKQSTSKLMKESLSTITIAAAAPKMESVFWDDLDTTRYSEVNPLTYGQKNAIKFYHFIDTASMKIGNVEYDPWRRFSLCEIQTLKTLSYWKSESISVFDSTAGKDTLIATSVMKKKMIAQSIFFKFNTDASGKQTIRLLYIGELGKKPPLSELPPLQRWWKGLDPAWKEQLSKQRKMEEYPKEGDLSRLTFIDELDLSKSTFTNFEPIAVFTGLEKLLLNDSKFNDLKILSKMTSLKYLNVSRTQVRSLDSIQLLKKLEEFYCVKNEIKDLSPLSTLKTLLKIDLSENDIEDLSPVANLEALTDLHLSLNIKIKDLSPISNLILLEKLSLRKIDLSNMSYLSKLNSLVYLDLYSAGITDVTPIARMKKLYYLDLSANRFTTLEPIRGLQFITHLYLNNSSMTSLDPVNNYIYLQELDVSNCPQIKSLSNIDKIPSVRVLKAISTGIQKEDIARFKKSHPNCKLWYY